MTGSSDGDEAGCWISHSGGSLFFDNIFFISSAFRYCCCSILQHCSANLFHGNEAKSFSPPPPPPQSPLSSSPPPLSVGLLRCYVWAFLVCLLNLLLLAWVYQWAWGALSEKQSIFISKFSLSSLVLLVVPPCHHHIILLSTSPASVHHSHHLYLRINFTFFIFSYTLRAREGRIMGMVGWQYLYIFTTYYIEDDMTSFDLH